MLLSSSESVRVPTQAPVEQPTSAEYLQRIEGFTAQAEALEATSKRASIVRLILFAVATAFLVATFPLDQHPALYLAAAIVLVVYWVVAKRHGQTIEALEQAQQLAEVNRLALARYERDWPSLPLPALDTVDGQPPKTPLFARDVDVIGRSSLSHLLGSIATPKGRATLLDWLFEPAEPEEISRRQEAVRELASEMDFRQQVERLAQPLSQRPAGEEPFARWAREPSSLAAKRHWLVLAYILGTAALVVPVACILLGLPFGYAFVVPMLNFIIAFRLGPQIEQAYKGLETASFALSPYARAFEELEKFRPLSPLLRSIWPDRSASQRLRSLAGTVDLASVRFQALAHFIVQSLLLWDLHVIARLDRWKSTSGHDLGDWLDGLGELECLVALAQLRADHPSWCDPSVDRGHEAFTAKALGHPLLPDSIRVANDIALGPRGTLLLVTGSNMSGKSTLLRSVGLNAVLSQAGGPACAASLSLPPVELTTSILIEDSLDQGVSFFLAELKRLKHIVDRARDEPARSSRVLLYLLDEILRGTNAAERLEAVRRVLGHLLQAPAIGAISTHDLRLAEAEEISERSTPIHLRETLNTNPELPPMTFDYLVRPGVAPTRNALKLLELVGLGEESSA